jgi:hypothetical protein
MATATEEKTVTLIDGTKIKVRPLKISLLRPFMKKFEDIAKDKEALEENLDLPTVYKIVEEASGIRLSDASLLGNLVNN